MAHNSKIMVARGYRTIAIMTIITSIIWTIMGILGAVNKPATINVPAEMLAPVNPNIDMEILNSLQSKRPITDEVQSDEVVQQAIDLIAKPSETPKATVKPSPSTRANPTATPAATPSADEDLTSEL